MNWTLPLFALILLLAACGDSKSDPNGDELDPDTAAEVRRVNLERYSGHWLLQGSKGSVYISLDENGYDSQELDKNDQVTGADFGRIKHRSVGKMILISDRSECAMDEKGAWLWMDRSGETVRLRSSDDENLVLDLVATDQRDRLRSAPCGTLGKAE